MILLLCFFLSDVVWHGHGNIVLPLPGVVASFSVDSSQLFSGHGYLWLRWCELATETSL